MSMLTLRGRPCGSPPPKKKTLASGSSPPRSSSFARPVLTPPRLATLPARLNSASVRSSTTSRPKSRFSNTSSPKLVLAAKRLSPLPRIAETINRPSRRRLRKTSSPTSPRSCESSSRIANISLLPWKHCFHRSPAAPRRSAPTTWKLSAGSPPAMVVSMRSRRWPCNSIGPSTPVSSPSGHKTVRRARKILSRCSTSRSPCSLAGYSKQIILSQFQQRKGNHMPSVAELMAALPEPAEESLAQQQDPLATSLAAWSLRPVPVGWFPRLRTLGTLQAKIGAAYLFHWLRGWFKNADENKRLLAEAHWRNAFRLLDSMSYLRGATMKIGQTLATFPDIVPRQFVETLERLHFDAPPMHWSLLKEMVNSELGDDPENIFAHFEKRAFAAASLGQVHRATLKTGEEVAVKIQYPGIARTIRDDFRNLFLFLLPARLTRDWECTKDQFDDIRLRLEHETDYEREAAMLQKIRPLFHEDDGIVAPRVYPEFSTARVRSMERLEGVHVDQFLAAHSSQELQNECGRKSLI